MYEDFSFSDYPYLEIKDFGVGHLNIDEAAELVAKILCLEGMLDISVPDTQSKYTLHNAELNDLLASEIEQFRLAICRGVHEGTLQTVRIYRDIDDKILTAETFVSADLLLDWLQERSIDISGDWYVEYIDNELKVAEAAIHAIQLQREKIHNYEKNSVYESKDSQIEFLEKRILALQAKIKDRENNNKAVKPLHVREQETLLKLLLGLALTNYEYNPRASRNSTSKEIADDLLLQGLSVDEDTVRKWLNQAKDLLPDNWQQNS